MKLYNTLTHNIEEFKPLNSKTNEVTVYTCGPTVYDYMHIGNLRTFVFSDILLRTLKSNGYDVKSAQNITDIDDKIINKAKEKTKNIKDISSEYTKFFLQDISKLNMQDPTFRPYATEFIDKMVDFIMVLLDKGFAYKEEDGSVYFDISKFPGYGELSGLDKRELKSGTRVLSDEYTKDNVQDFALWKAVPKDEVGAFDTKIGWGRPGWHIECSVMSQSLLGEKIDIHTGGVDLIFPHHENEIAQSEAKTGKKPFVRFWVHGAHMLVEGKKMSKSLKNFYTLSDIQKRGFEPLALRYLFLQTHYRQEMNFTWEALEAAQNALSKLRRRLLDMKQNSEGFFGTKEIKDSVKFINNWFEDAISEDLNIPLALGAVWQMVDNANIRNKEKLEYLFRFDKILGLRLDEWEEKEMPDAVKKLLEMRDALRKEKKYEEADKIRDEVIKMGYKVEDN